MNQLLIQTDSDFESWKQRFETEAATMTEAGLSTLQIWKTDTGAAVLLKLTDRKRAEDWLQRQSAFGRGYAALFLQTA
ncbi:hypothetical protein [Szabonella alba]|uniref:Uncharacterized protein n=1 Tax=Szabonella alba TaxID=2804194 RepID=A0A8K0Y2Q7_9RHOB|nr:hypothetical protein [Szabonella alba]MBL4918754.1 hypothetical protein [Szabonella alba]